MRSDKLTKYEGKAFISCSLREEDKDFVNGIEKIVRSFKFEPFGTVGRHSIAPRNVAEHIKENIIKADMADKPVIAFVKKGTDTGSFLSLITEYVVLKEPESDIEKNWKKITSLLNNTWKIVVKNRSKKSDSEWKGIVIGSLATYGVYQLIRRVISK